MDIGQIILSLINYIILMVNMTITDQRTYRYYVQIVIHKPIIGVLKNINYCKDCGKEISRSSTYCIKCAVKHRNQFKVDPKDRPDKEKLLSLIKEYPFTKIGEMYGVTDNTIRKWCKNYGIPHTKKELRELILENK